MTEVLTGMVSNEWLDAVVKADESLNQARAQLVTVKHLHDKYTDPDRHDYAENDLMAGLFRDYRLGCRLNILSDRLLGLARELGNVRTDCREVYTVQRKIDAAISVIMAVHARANELVFANAESEDQLPPGIVAARAQRKAGINR